jgi:uncharacterized protein (DUF2141 family)
MLKSTPGSRPFRKDLAGPGSVDTDWFVMPINSFGYANHVSRRTAAKAGGLVN